MVKNLRLICILLSMLSLSSSCQSQIHQYNPNFEISARNFCDTIPIEIEDDQIYINVEIQGRRYRFNLDTGSSQGMVFRGDFLRSCKELGNIISRDANNHLDTVKVVQMPSFRMGHINISGYVASLMPRPSVSNKYDAIIGFDLFNRGLCAKIDARHKWLILSNRKKIFDYENGYTLKYKLKWFVPYVTVSPFLRHDDQALFDLGSKSLYTINKHSFDEHVAKDLSRLSRSLGADIQSQIEGRTVGQMSIGGHGAERRDEVVFLKLDRLKWGDFSFEQFRTMTTQGASRIGAELLRYGNVIINPFKRTITFQPFTIYDNVKIGNKPMRVAFVPNGNKASVGLVHPKSDAYKAGLRSGDIILQIGDRPINTWQQFLAFPFVEGDNYIFTVRDLKGATKHVEMSRWGE